MNQRVSTLISGRREKMANVLGRALPEPQGVAGPPGEAVRSHLLGEARNLYVNELEWEYLTDEESMESGPLVQLTFPGFLAFIRGLLLSEVMPDALAPADPRPEVVEDILNFLAARVVELEEVMAAGGADEPEQLGRELSMAGRLMDHVLYSLHRLSAEDVGRLEDTHAEG